MDSPTYSEIANDWALWCEYADPGANGTEEEFDAMEHDERIAFLVECFGAEETYTD